MGSALLLGATTARADDLPPPPDRCPPGAVPTTQHAGQWCAVTTCETDADCEDRALERAIGGFDARREVTRRCRPRALCVEEERYTPGGLYEEPPAPRTRRIARGPCVDDRCPRGGRCVRASRCVVAPAAGPAPAGPEGTSAESSAASTSDDGGCAVGAGRASPLAAWIAALGLLGARRRPRER